MDVRDASHAADGKGTGGVGGGSGPASGGAPSARAASRAPTNTTARRASSTADAATSTSGAASRHSSTSPSRQPSPASAEGSDAGNTQTLRLSTSRSGTGIDARPTAPRMAKTAERDLLILESCHSTWLFDRAKMRFRRILKGLDLDVRQASTGWRDYFGLELDSDSESFVVLLNRSGTRLLRSWRHLENCRQCGTESTSEISLAELRKAAGV